jgi:hypothetical protein
VAGTGGSAGGGQGGNPSSSGVVIISIHHGIDVHSPATAAAVESTPKIELLESTPTVEKAIKGFLEPPAHQNPRISSTETQNRCQHDVTELT